MPPPDAVRWSFLIDEDMSRSMAPTLRTAGYQAEDVREVGLSGKPDPVIFAYAQAHQQTLITADMGFANIVQLPNTLSTVQVNRQLLQALTVLAGQTLTGLLVIIEPGRVRVRSSS